MVRDRQTKGGVLIRARAKADIWNLYRRFKTKFKMTRPKADEHRDYRWRMAMKKRDWAKIMYRLAMQIDYCNFKDEVHKHPDQDNKNSAYMSVWSAMLRVQHMEDEPKNGQSYFGGFEMGWQRELDYAIAEEQDAILDRPILTYRGAKEAREKAEVEQKVKHLLGH